MARVPLPPLPAVVSFIDCVNRGDIDGLAALLTSDHQLLILDEAPVVGRAANIEAWTGYFSSFPEYLIHPTHLVADGPIVSIRGSTTGSHLGLPDDEELALAVLWEAEVVGDVLARWRIVDDSPAVAKEDS